MIEINITEKQKFRFFQSFIKTDFCWIWQKSLDKDGYGRFAITSKYLRAHRVSYYLHNGEIPKNKLVRHSCDNPICVNPNHLILGTNLDNSRDMVSRKRHRTGDAHHFRTKPHLIPRGERAAKAKLTDEKVKQIRQEFSDKLFNKTELAAINGVSIPCISHIISKKTWKHIL